MAHDPLRSCILSAMRARSVLEIGVAAATALSVGLLVVMLASPWLPQASDAPMPSAAESTAAPSPSAGGEEPPIGLYLLRGAFSFGPCLALELSPESYPVAEDADGTATVLWWQRGMTGCDARTGDVHELDASVSRDLAEDDGHLIGYAVDFTLPLDANSEQSVAAQITILAAQSTDDLLQALDTSAGSSGFGLVLDRVPAVDPPLNPLPSTAPAAIQPTGLFLLEGPFGGDGPCLVLELTDASYPADPGVEGTAVVRWWERAVADPDDPAQCLRRLGDIQEVEATVIVTVRDENDLPAAYGVHVRLQLASGQQPEDIAIVIALDESTVEQLHATVVRPSGVPPLVLDRVDSIDPPLGPPPPSASPGG
jgi:hypothetical protein